MPIKRSRSWTAFLVGVAALLLNTTAARASVSFNAHRATLANVGDPFEITLTKRGPAISAEGFSEIQISSTGAKFQDASAFTNTRYILAGNPTYGPDPVAMSFVEPTSRAGGAGYQCTYQCLALGMISVDSTSLWTNGNRGLTEFMSLAAGITQDSGDLFPAEEGNSADFTIGSLWGPQLFEAALVLMLLAILGIVLRRDAA